MVLKYTVLKNKKGETFGRQSGIISFNINLITVFDSKRKRL